MIELYHWEPNANSGKPIIALYEKGVDFVSHYTDLLNFDQHKPEYLKMNPLGTIPTLVHDDMVFAESTQMCEYIDAAFDGPPLRPADPMERWRMLPRNMGNKFVLVNIASYHLYAVENNRDALNMKIVVGKPKWNTPIFSEEMTHIVINPYWDIPPSIFKDDIAPLIRSDPTPIMPSTALSAWDRLRRCWCRRARSPPG